MNIHLNKLETLAKAAQGDTPLCVTPAYIEFVNAVSPEIVLTLIQQNRQNLIAIEKARKALMLVDANIGGMLTIFQQGMKVTENIWNGADATVDIVRETLVALGKPVAETGDGWISVKDRLPELSRFNHAEQIIEKPILVATDKGRVFETIFILGGFANLNNSGEVTHWRPLPVAPKGNE